MAGTASHLIEILIKLLGSDEAKKKMKETGDAAAAMNQKISQGAKDAGKLYTALASSTARIGSLIPTSLPLGQLAKDLTRVTSAGLGVSSAMKGLNVNLGLVAGVAAGTLGAILLLKKAFDGLKVSISAAGETQESIIKLGNAYKTLGAYTREGVARATSFANSMQLVTKYSDEEILRTQALLAQLGRLSGEGLERATKATLDLASGLGRELPVAALIMAKAAQGSTWELRKYGLVLDENLPKTERWAAALKFVESQFGGRAQEEIKGFNATVRQFGGAFKDVLTLIGAPIIIPATKAIHALTVAMLKFTAARDKAQNKKLLPEDDSVDIALAKFKAANEELDRLQRRRGDLQERLHIVHPITDEEFQEAIKNRNKALNDYRNTLAAYVRQIPIDKAIEKEKEFEKQMLAAAKALGDARKDTSKSKRDIQELEDAWRESIKTHADWVAALSQRFKFSYEGAVADLNAFIGKEDKALQPREQQITIKGDIELENIKKEVDKFFKDPKTLEAFERGGQGPLPSLDITFRAKLEQGDPEAILQMIDEVKRDARERGATFLLKYDSDPYNAVHLKEDLDFLTGIVEKEGVARFKVIMDQETVKRIDSGLKAFRERYQFKGEQIELFKFDENIIQLKTLDEALAKIREAFGKIGDIKEPQDQVRAYNDLLQLLANLIPSATKQAKESIVGLALEMQKQYAPLAEIWAADAGASMDAIEAQKRLALIRKELNLAITAKDWEKAVDLAGKFGETLKSIEVPPLRQLLEAELEGFNTKIDNAITKTTVSALPLLRKQLAYAISGRDWERAIVLAQRFSDIIKTIEAPDLREALDAELKDWNRKIAQAKEKAAVAPLTGLRKELGFALKASDWETFIELAKKFSDVVETIKTPDLRRELDAELKDWYRRLDEAQKKAREVSEEVSHHKTLFRLYLELEQWDAADEQIAALEALLDKLPEEKRIELQLYIEKSKVDEVEAIFRVKERIIRAAIEVKDVDTAIEQLKEIKKLLEDPALSEDQKKVLELQVQGLELDIAEAKLTTFQQTVIQSFNSTLQQLMNLPWDAFGQLATGIFDAMLDDAKSVADAIAQVFRNLVDDIINIMAKLAIQSAIASAFGIPFLGFFTGGFLGKPESPQQPPTSKPTPPDKVTVPVELMLPDWSSLAYSGAPISVPVAFAIPDQLPFDTTLPSFRAEWPSFDFAPAPIKVPVQIEVPEELKQRPWGAIAEGRRDVQINISAIDSSSIRRQLETGDLGKELSRLMR